MLVCVASTFGCVNLFIRSLAGLGVSSRNLYLFLFFFLQNKEDRRLSTGLLLALMNPMTSTTSAGTPVNMTLIVLPTEYESDMKP